MVNGKGKEISIEKTEAIKRIEKFIEQWREIINDKHTLNIRDFTEWFIGASYIMLWQQDVISDLESKVYFLENKKIFNGWTENKSRA